MLNKKMICLIALGFFCLSLLFTASCAKKQIRGAEEGVTPPKTGEGPGEPKAPPRRPPRPKVPESSSIDWSKEDAAKLKKAIAEFENEKIYFDYDRSELKPIARDILMKKAAWLRDNPGYSVQISGHCDERGTNEYNLALGERRANAAWKFLNALGISGSRMKTVSYGEEMPADPGHNQRAWRLNRRDEFKLSK